MTIETLVYLALTALFIGGLALLVAIERRTNKIVAELAERLDKAEQLIEHFQMWENELRS